MGQILKFEKFLQWAKNSCWKLVLGGFPERRTRISHKKWGSSAAKMDFWAKWPKLASTWPHLENFPEKLWKTTLKYFCTKSCPTYRDTRFLIFQLDSNGKFSTFGFGSRKFSKIFQFFKQKLFFLIRHPLSAIIFLDSPPLV